MNAVILPPKLPLQSRSFGPDLIRAGSAVLVVYLHACVPYLVHPMPGLVWPVRDASSAFCDCAYWAIEVFIMPLFLVISGFYSYRSLCQVDGKAFLTGRAKRLLCPLLFGVLFVLPMDLYVWVLGFVTEGLIPITKLKSLKVPSPFGDHLWGLSHLWFLLYVFLYAAVMLAVRKLLRDPIPMRLRPLVRQGSAIAIALVGFVCLVIAPEVVYGFQHAFAPVFSKWVYCGTFFAGGIAIAIFDPHFRTVDRLAVRHFSLGIIVTAAAVLLGCWTLRIGVPVNGTDYALDYRQAGSSIWASMVLAAMTVVAAWAMTLGMIGLANRIAPRLEQHARFKHTVQYLASASFWIYVMHHPWVGLLHIDLKWISPTMWPLLKSLVCCSAVLAFGLVSYEWLIRDTRLGRLIGIAAPIKPSVPVDDPMTEVSDQRRPAVRIAA